MTRRIVACSLATALLIASSCWAQDLPAPGEIDPELHALESAYAKEIQKARKSLGANYLSALGRLQADLTRRSQIEQAFLVKRERERVTQLLEHAPETRFPSAGSKPPQRVDLDVSRARCFGGTVYDERRGNVRNWTAAGGAVHWELDADMPAGRYDVIIDYNAGRDAGGTFDVATGGGQRVRAEVKTSGESDWKINAQMLAGTVAIDPDSRSLQITATALRQPYLWTVSAVRLEPAGTWAKQQAANSAKGERERRRPPGKTTPRPPRGPQPKNP